jgi:hypothetical protein
MTAREKLSAIESALAAGRTVYLCTYTRATKITPKNAARFAAAGRPIVKATDEHLYMVEGRHYVCADYCAIRFE